MNKTNVLAALERGHLRPAENGPLVYAYADAGPNADGIEAEWLLEFCFEADELVGFSIQQQLVAP